MRTFLHSVENCSSHLLMLSSACLLLRPRNDKLARNQGIYIYFSNYVKEQVPNPLHLTSQFRLYSVAEMLIRNSAEVNALSGREASALQITGFAN
jgi:hypothetical protein